MMSPSDKNESTSRVIVVAPATLPEGATFLVTLDGIEFAARIPAGGVRKGESFETMYPTMVKVVAPFNLHAGEGFESEYEGTRFWATAPAGGVKQGEWFETLHPAVAPERDQPTVSPKREQPVVAPENKKSSIESRQGDGQWRTGLFDCFDGNNKSCCELIMMAFCCVICLNAQIMQRLNLNCAGQPSASGNQSNVYKLHVGITIGIILVTILSYAVFWYSWSNLALNLYLFMRFVLAGWFIYVLVAMTCTRKSMREHYKLKGACCGESCLDDFCVTYWCSCCSAIQMANQTHDPKEYGYSCCTPTGMGPEAPSCAIV